MWDVLELPVDAEYTRAAKLLICGLCLLLILEFIQIGFTIWSMCVILISRRESKVDRMKIMKDILLILEMVKGLCALDKVHRHRMMESASDLRQVLPEVKDQIKAFSAEIKQTISEVPDKVKEKITGPDSGMGNLKIPDQLK